MSLATENSALLPGTSDSAYLAGPREFVSLMKPRVMSLVVLTALAGMLIAPGSLNPVVGFASLTAIAIGAGADDAIELAEVGAFGGLDGAEIPQMLKDEPDTRFSRGEAV